MLNKHNCKHKFYNEHVFISGMFGKEAVKLVTELDMHEDIRPFNVSIIIYYYYSTVSTLKFPFNLQEQVMRQVFEEMQMLYEANLEDRYIIHI